MTNTAFGPAPIQTPITRDGELVSVSWSVWMSALSNRVAKLPAIQDFHVSRVGGSFAITAASWAGGIATVTAPGHTFAVGQKNVNVAGVSPVGYNALVVITAVAGNNFSYSLVANPGAYVSGGTATAANLYSAATQGGGLLYYETDRGVLYASRFMASGGSVNTAGTAVTWVSGAFFLTSWVGNQITINGASYPVAAVSSNGTSLTLGASAGVQAGVSFSINVWTWMYLSGLMEGTFPQAPTDLGVSDAGFLYHVTTGSSGLNYNHVVQWTGTQWQAAPGERLGGYFGEYVKAPTDAGWHLADGSAIKYLDISGGALIEVSFTLPSLVGTPAYKKTAVSYTGTINSAAGATGNDSASQTVASGSGVSVAAHPHTHSFTGDPVANLGVLPYFRM